MNHKGFRRWLEPTYPYPVPSPVPVVEVAIVPVSPAAGFVVDVALVPRYKVELRGLVIDTTAPRRQWPTFRSEACALACVAALNLGGGK